MDRNTLTKIQQTLITTLQILGCFEASKEKIPYKLECLKVMLFAVQPYGDFYLVSDVYANVASSLNTNISTVRGIFDNLCQAGFLKREFISVPSTTDHEVKIDVFSLTGDAIKLLSNE